MTIENQRGSDLGVNTEQSIEQIEVIKRKYIEAYAIGLGANEVTAKMSTDALLRNAEALAAIELKDKDELSAGDAKQIEAIGEWLLVGSEKQNEIKFNVASRALRLLRSDINSNTFQKLGEWVEYYAGSSGADKFNQLIGEKE